MAGNKPALLDLSKYNQLSFVGGMNLLGDDTRLQPNQYRIGFNLTNRFDQLDEIFQSVEDKFAPNGIKQEITTLGNYQLLFVAGFAFYKLYTDLNWKEIPNFQMDRMAPRYWTVQVPVSTTNYVRFAATGVLNTGTSNPAGTIQTANIAGANKGNVVGVLVQDNINQPYFIFLDVNNLPTARVTQNIKQWNISFTDATNTVVANDINGIPLDNREYVPIGNSMTWDDGILYITSQDTNFLYRSVSGRPLDFVVNVTNVLATNAAPVVLSYPTTTGIQALNGITIAPFTQVAGGDATSTSYSVGVGGISCIRQMSSGGIFVSASNANFNVSKNLTPNAPTIFGEYTFIRTFLFNANCLSDRAIFDTTGDTRFIDLTGVRSFNAIEQEQNEGRNSVFTNTISAAFKNIIQDPSNVAGILFDNYELYAVQTIFGPALAKYDTINNCWTSFEISQTGNKLVKILTKIELAVQALYAVTQDDRVFQLYKGPQLAIATVRTIGVCSSVLYANSNLKFNNPENEIKLAKCRVVMNNIVAPASGILTQPAGSISFTPYINNRVTKEGTVPKNIFFEEPAVISNNATDLPDVNTQLCNICFATPNCEQGFKMFGIFQWTGGSITQYMMQMEDIEPENSMSSRGGKVV